MGYLPVLFLIVVLPIALRAASTCPTRCFCASGSVTCLADTVDRIPNVDHNITALTISLNRLTVPTLSRNNFSHFTNLLELTISDCGIQNIQPNAFADLTKLTRLDLSSNNLRAIDPDALAGLNLRFLFLGDNPSIILPESGFTRMSTETIELKNCELAELPPSFFTPLTQSLQKLYINGNRITRFSREMLTIFSDLTSLRIHDNPLVCDCESRWLKEFYDQNPNVINSQTKPRCSEPLQMSGLFFNHLQVSEFLCEKPTLKAEMSLKKDKAILKCVTTGYPSPMISLYRPSGVIEVTSPTNNHATETEIEVAAANPLTHGEYRCVASNEAGNASLSVNLTSAFYTAGEQVPCDNYQATTSAEVLLSNGDEPDSESDQPAEEADVFKRKYFSIIDIIVAVFGTFAGTLIITVIVLHVCVYRKKKPSSQYSTPPQSEYSTSSIKNEPVYPHSSQHMQIHAMHQTQNLQNMQNRPLPHKPYPHKAYDENHYMSTQLDDSNDLARLGQHNGGALVSPQSPPPCQACQTINSQHRHSQAL